MTIWGAMGAAALAGAAAALGHAPFSLWYLALAGFAFLALVVSRQPTARRALLCGWLGGIGYFGVALHWIVEPFLVDAATHGWMAPGALILVAVGFGLFWALAGWLSARLGGVRALGWVLCLAALEMVRGYIFTGFPWALPAYIWADTPIIRVAAHVGPYGLSALTLIVATGLTAFALPKRDGVVTGTLGAVSAALILVLPVPTIGEAPDGPRVRLVQPNAPQDEKWDRERAFFFVERMIGFTGEAKDGVELIVWPETSIPYRLDGAGPVLTAIAGAAEGVPVIAGINRTDDGQIYNSLIVIGAGGAVEQTFDKSHLVPFGEYIPFRIEFLRAMAAFSSFGFTPGDGARGIDTPLGRAWALICYEAIFPQHAGGGDPRPAYLLQITNDAWFGGFSGPYQHLDQARFRAVEQGLPLIRAANTGVSAVIDPAGRIVDHLPLGVPGYLDAALPAPGPRTLYSRIGDSPVGGAILVTLVAVWWVGRRKVVANGKGLQ